MRREAMESLDRSRDRKAQCLRYSLMGLGHRHHDSMREAFLQNGNVAQRGEEWRVILHVPRLPLAVHRGKQGSVLDRNVGIQAVNDPPQFSDGDAIKSPELVCVAQLVWPVIVSTARDNVAPRFHQCWARKQDIRPGHFR